VAWCGDELLFLESKGPGDALKPSQIDWFKRAVQAGVPIDHLGVVEWRPNVHLTD
jgi:hypothetical protein